MYSIFFSVANAELNFAVLGNWGAGSWTQQSVAGALSKYCDQSSCSFVVSPGSNFTSSVSDCHDDVFQSQFSSVYNQPGLTLPFYTTLGQEDWRGNVTAEAFYSMLQFGFMRGDDPRLKFGDDQKEVIDQRAIAAQSGPKFVLPNWYWNNVVNFQDKSGNAIFGAHDRTAAFIYIDTHILSDSFSDEETRGQAWDYLRTALKTAQGAFDWTIVVGDTSIYSSGKQGSSKEFEANLRPMLKEFGVDAYISGNDYDMEILEDGPMALLNCGNGSSASGRGLWSAPGSRYFVGKPGFCTVKLEGSKMTLGLHDGGSGDLLHSAEHIRAEKSSNFISKGLGLAGMPKSVYVPLPWGIGGSIGPNGEGTLMSPGVITFIKVVGTAGMFCCAFTSFIAAITSGTRIQKLLG